MPKKDIERIFEIPRADDGMEDDPRTMRVRIVELERLARHYERAAETWKARYFEIKKMLW